MGDGAGKMQEREGTERRAGRREKRSMARLARKIKRDKKKREFRPSQNEQRREIRCVEWKAELAALQKRWKEKAAAKKAEKEV